MNTINDTQETAPTVQKKTVERSAAYPAITIEEAIQFVESIAKNFPGTPAPFVTREDIAAVLKTKVGNIHRDIAAAAHYKFLQREKDSYQVTSLFKTILNPLSDSERQKCLLEAFAAPKLYNELLAKHDGHAIPTELKTHLIRFHKIAEKAAQEVADEFIANAKFTGAVNEHGILIHKQTLSRLADGGIPYAEVIQEKQQTPNSGTIINLIEDNSDSKKELLLPPVPENEQIKVPLSEKKVAYISYPPNIKKKDIEILRIQLDLLELLAE